MPQVPYSPVPDVRPSGQGAPALNVSTPGAAFGTNVAEAIKGVGGELDKVGGEIFQRAMALQDLNNRTQADQASSTFVEQMGLKHAEFAALQGEDAVKALPDHMKDIHELRDQVGEGLNPMAKKLYDTETRNQAARTIFNAAGHAATQNKQWMISNADAQIKVDSKTVSDNPDDDKLYEQQLAKAKGNSIYLASLHGFGADSPYADLKEKESVSQVTLFRILSKAKSEPAAAMDMYQKLKGNLTGPDLLHAETAVMGQNRSVGSANMAQTVFASMYDENGKQIKSLTEAEKEVRDKATEFSPKDPILANNAVRTLRTLTTQKFQAEKIGDWESGQQIREIIQQHPEITTEQQLRTLPEARAVLDGLNHKGRGIDAPKMIHNYINSRFEEVNEENFYKLKSLAQHDRNAFLDIQDFADRNEVGPLNVKQVDQLNEYRKKLIRNPDDDPHLRNALNWMRGEHGAELQALGIYGRDKNNPDDYDKYSGAMLQAIDAWKTENKRAPGFKDIVNEIGPQVIKQNTTKGWFGMTNQTPTFKMEPPADFIDKVRKKFPGRSEEDLKKDYIGYIFQKMFGATVSSDKITGGRDNAVTNRAAPQSAMDQLGR